MYYRISSFFSHYSVELIRTQSANKKKLFIYLFSVTPTQSLQPTHSFKYIAQAGGKRDKESYKQTCIYDGY